ncbi:MAG: M16 family metallopeptidase [Patescibacteria group bacterium]|jgi:predicted Zn-dependent peptidase
MNGNVKINQLENGLRYITVPIPGVKSATALALVKAGTRYETSDNNGISHFLEHMVFKGTEKMPTALDIATKVDSIGGSFNAFTGKEYTGYYVTAAVSHLDLAMDVVSQLIFHPRLPKRELEVERGVILEEIRMYEDEPQARVSQLFDQVMFSPATLGWDTLGKPEIIKSLPQEAFKEYLDYLYVPNRIVVVVAGGISEETNGKVKAQLTKYFGKEKPNTKFNERHFTFKQTKPKKKVIVKPTEQCHLIYGYRTFGRDNENRYALSVLATVLGGGMSSRLFTEIREKRGLAYYVGSVRDTYTESGYVGMRAGTKPESAQQVLDIAQAEFSKLHSEPISDKELTKAKEYIKGHLLLRLENSYEVAGFFAEDLLMEDKTRSIDEVLAKVDAVKAEDVQRLAGELFIDKSKNVAAIGPSKVVEKLAI